MGLFEEADKFLGLLKWTSIGFAFFGNKFLKGLKARPTCFHYYFNSFLNAVLNAAVPCIISFGVWLILRNISKDFEARHIFCLQIIHVICTGLFLACSPTQCGAVEFSRDATVLPPFLFLVAVIDYAVNSPENVQEWVSAKKEVIGGKLRSALITLRSRKKKDPDKTISEEEAPSEAPDLNPPNSSSSSGDGHLSSVPGGLWTSHTHLFGQSSTTPPENPPTFIPPPYQLMNSTTQVKEIIGPFLKIPVEPKASTSACRSKGKKTPTKSKKAIALQEPLSWERIERTTRSGVSYSCIKFSSQLGYSVVEDKSPLKTSNSKMQLRKK